MTARLRLLTGDELTDAVIPAASALVWAVRQNDPDAVDAALDDAIASARGPGLHALLVVLAAMVPDDRSPAELLAWRTNPDTYLELRYLGLGADVAINAMRLHHSYPVHHSYPAPLEQEHAS